MAEQTERIKLPCTKLYEAALEGDVPTLLNLLRDDPLLLEQCSTRKSAHFAKSPLHLAANLGHIKFTREIVQRKPELAEELDKSRRWSPLHMASAKGYLDIVKILIVVNPGVCLVRDQDGRNPIHIAAATGQVDVLGELLNAMPQAAQVRTNCGDTALHLCVKHCQQDALEFLVNVVDDTELLNSGDRDGNTVLHLAVAAKQPEMIQFLLNDKRIGTNAININGLTVMDAFIRSRKDLRDQEIKVLLKRAQAMKARNALQPRNKDRDRLEGQRNGLIVVASLIATMAFTVGVSPPGGAWQDNNSHTAGTAIVEDVKKPRNGSTEILFFKDKTGLGEYDMILIFNTIGLVSSLSVILLLISGLPCKRLFVGILTVILWAAVTTTAVTYTLAVNFLVSAKPDRTVWRSLEYSLAVWRLLMIILFVGHLIRFVIWLTKKLFFYVKVRLHLWLVNDVNFNWTRFTFWPINYVSENWRRSTFWPVNYFTENWRRFILSPVNYVTENWRRFTIWLVDYVTENWRRLTFWPVSYVTDIWRRFTVSTVNYVTENWRRFTVSAVNYVTEKWRRLTVSHVNYVTGNRRRFTF